MSGGRGSLAGWGTLVAALAVLTGCADSSTPLPFRPDLVVVGAAACTNTDLEFGVMKLVKIGASGTFEVVVTDLNGTQVEPTQQVSLDAGDCAVVDEITGGFHIVTVTEISGTPTSITCQATFDCPTTTNSASAHIGTSADFQKGAVVFFTNPTGMAPGRMTGGGFQIRIDRVRISRGLTLHCDILLSNNLEINWPGGNNWHITRPLLSADCIDDPTVSPVPPPAPFDTFIGEAMGSLNQVEGSICRFTFVDAGEPGTSDRATIRIWAPGANPDVDAPVLEVSGFLDGGNLQAHFDQPHM